MSRFGNECGFFYESAAQRTPDSHFNPASSFGVAQNDDAVSFDEHFESVAAKYKERGIDIKKEMGKMVDDPLFMEEYKKDLFAPVVEGFEAMSPNDPHIKSIIENVNRFWDTKVKNYTESAAMVGYLPISTLEFPVLVKQMFQSVLKDIIEVESVKSPNITKHIRTTYMVDNQTGNEYEYPKCLFDGTWQNIWDASRGHKIRNDVVPLTNGRLWKYDIISGLTDGDPDIDELSMEFKIIAVQVGSEVIQLPGNGITVEFSTNGTLVNGDLNFEAPSGTKVEDTLSGQVDFRHATITMSSAAGLVTGVVFEGYLSNANNMRSVSVREKRSLLRITIADGPRWVMPFTIEDIEDASAMLDINYYNRMVDEIVKTQDMTECMTVIKFLTDQQKKFNGVKTDTWNLESLAVTDYVDLKAPDYFAGDPFKYKSTAIQFKLKAMMQYITDLMKLDDLSFVIVGNPMVTQLISEFTQWKVNNNTSIGGITVNGSYGFATDMGANVRVVGTNIYDAYTEDKVATTNQRELVLHVYGYPTSPDHVSFRHLKFSNHLMTSQNQTAYQSPQAPAGAYQIVTATARYKDIAIQGITADLILLHSDLVYGSAPSRPPVTGAPWSALASTPTVPVTPPVGP